MSAFRQMKWARRSCHEAYKECNNSIKRLDDALWTVDISEKDKEQVELWREILFRAKYELEHIDNWMSQHLGDK